MTIVSRFKERERKLRRRDWRPSWGSSPFHVSALARAESPNSASRGRKTACDLFDPQPDEILGDRSRLQPDLNRQRFAQEREESRRRHERQLMRPMRRLDLYKRGGDLMRKAFLAEPMPVGLLHSAALTPNALKSAAGTVGALFAGGRVVGRLKHAAHSQTRSKQRAEIVEKQGFSAVADQNRLALFHHRYCDVSFRTRSDGRQFCRPRRQNGWFRRTGELALPPPSMFTGEPAGCRS